MSPSKKSSNDQFVGSPAIEDVRLIKTRQRVLDHGEVFTPSWMVDAMLDLVKNETERIDSRFLEPACGSGNFLVSVLKRKLAAVESRYGKHEFERRNYALLGLMCIYGIELLADNALECRKNLLDVLASYLKMGNAEDFFNAAKFVLDKNIVQGDALTLTDTKGHAIVFSEWGYLGKGRFQRRDFQYESLTRTSAFEEDCTLLSGLGYHSMFEPIKNYPTLTVGEIAGG